MADEFLGTGWSFPVEPDHRGNVACSDAERDIQEAIRIVLGTAKGERLMRPDFGCDIHDHVYAATTPATLNLIETDVRRALVRWEPRIDVEDVTARIDEENPNRILIDVEYYVRTTNSLGNVVYPFHTTEGDG